MVVADPCQERRKVPAIVPCETCKGKGLAPRPAADIARHQQWVQPLFAEEPCPDCGGGGKKSLTAAQTKARADAKG